MKKAELEEHHAMYKRRMTQALADERAGKWADAIAAALFALEFVDAMLKYERKYIDSDIDSVSAIDMIYRLAPLLFDIRALDSVGSLLKEHRQVDRNTTQDLADGLARARTDMLENHRLWRHLELTGPVKQNEIRKILGGDQTYWRNLAEKWELAGVVTRFQLEGNYIVRLATSMDEITTAKCYSCGSLVSLPKSMLLESLECTACGDCHQFVILMSES